VLKNADSALEARVPFFPDDKDDPADYLPVINPGIAVTQREKWFDPAHLCL
jgi:hypothetical protein